MAQPLESLAAGLGGMVDELSAVETQLRELLAGLPDEDTDPEYDGLDNLLLFADVEEWITARRMKAAVESSRRGEDAQREAQHGA